MLLPEVVVVVAVDEVDALGLVDGLFVEEGTPAANHDFLEVLVLFEGGGSGCLLRFGCLLRGRLFSFSLLSRFFCLLFLLLHNLLILHLNILQTNLHLTLSQRLQIAKSLVLAKTFRLKLYNIILRNGLVLNHFIKLLFTRTQLLYVVNELTSLLFYVDLFVEVVVDALGEEEAELLDLPKADDVMGDLSQFFHVGLTLWRKVGVVGHG
jgi:hypothetical protein